MPENYVFHVLVTGDIAHDGEQFAGVTLNVQQFAAPWTRLTMLRRTWVMIVRGIRMARKEGIDVVISYDPLTLGFIGVLVKLFSGAKLVVEVNGHIRDAKDLSLAGGKVGFLRRKLFNLVGSLSLHMADCVKILNRRQYEEWQTILSRKKVVMFHDYVPTSQFVLSERDDCYLYCLGYPFYRKGVDILLEAFAIIQQEFPDIRLVIMGHCREPELSRWKARARGIANVEFHKPVPYDEVADYLGTCTVLAVPSRSEGMGRVFIEAMASGKPCVGTRVGGIPNVIADGRSGFLVNPEDPQDLADKLRILLADKSLRQRMGKVGRHIAETTLSDRQYVLNFQKMMDILLDDSSPCRGICFNGFAQVDSRPDR
ncbi:glycosyltransferase family 4 protein [Desulfonatronum thiodismutans]|uniref:glycosyltransferase family 4 protein n=1 Tax=Desulfonatronum thiodismutans TaxID=159290 RepID=UPI0009FFAE22|nr:glycosyltransferase [Desulfonatronum thiodismutans]